ncbi:MAG: AAA family ATPase [Chryseotalea sp. WA131a]|nr:MAG: AAA family ATPase [Chryseotalea sp. WA131a]
MRIIKVKVQNFRGIKSADLILSNHTVLVGDNNIGKSTILEALDLVLGPERLYKFPVIDEHDFYVGNYSGNGADQIQINIEVLLIDLNEEQLRKFRNNIEYYNKETHTLIEGPPAEETDQPGVYPVLRVAFKGFYDEGDDDFKGETYFCHPEAGEGEKHSSFTKTDKRLCGYLYLRTIRTGSRALTLERGSLLDIILHLSEIRPKMWEDVLSQLRIVSVADDPTLGISDILSSVQKSIRAFVPIEWADSPRLRVTSLTREELRRVLTVFIGTGEVDDQGIEYGAPYQHQGTGTINVLVLTLLVMIAELKQNVIFAMEECETAIPPYAQKRIVNNVMSIASQSIFTSHSPYVLEEFTPENILVVKREKGVFTGTPASYPPTIKPKKYKEEFKKRFCEALLSRRVLITEGRTEFDAFPSAARKLHEIDSSRYSTLEGLGIAVINAETDSQIEPLGKFFKDLGKVVYATFDKQEPTVKAAIDLVVHHSFEAPETSFEKVILNGTADTALRRFAGELVSSKEWPSHLHDKTPTSEMPLEELKGALLEYFNWSKGSGDAGHLLSQCTEHELPVFVKDTLLAINATIDS